MFFDTHCHLNFGAFDGRVEDVINEAKRVGVNEIVIPGTDVPTSKMAIEIAEKYEGVYAAVGIHPHHVFEIYEKKRSSATQFLSQRGPFPESEKITFASDLKNIDAIIHNPKVVAIGEIGIDRHYYQKTKHKDYKVDEEFVELQKIFFLEQIKLAIKYKKALIFHNREAKKDVINVLTNYGLRIADYRSVFHCCEPDPELLEFAKEHKMFIGVDGDITYYKEKQSWIKTVPLDMLVLETDSPFLAPRIAVKSVGVDPRVDPSIKSARQSNEPKNIPVIAEFVAKLKGVSIDAVAKQTTENARILFRL